MSRRSVRGDGQPNSSQRPQGLAASISRRLRLRIHDATQGGRPGAEGRIATAYGRIDYDAEGLQMHQMVLGASAFRLQFHQE